MLPLSDLSPTVFLFAVLLVFLFVSPATLAFATGLPTADRIATQHVDAIAPVGVSALPAFAVNAVLEMRDDGYNAAYIFGMTKGLAASTMIPAFKPLFFILTIPLDLALLPFAALGGFF